MNTPAHLIFGTAAFGKPGTPRVTGAAFAGALLPDLSLYLLVGWAMGVQGISAQVVFRELYYSDAWQAVFSVDNSLILWGALFALAWWRKAPVLFAFAGAGVLHILLDLPLHNDDARPHFWPLTDRLFISPFSYWDSAHYAGIIGPIELIVSLGLCGWMLWRFRSLAMRAGIVVMGVAETLSTNIWRFVF